MASILVLQDGCEVHEDEGQQGQQHGGLAAPNVVLRGLAAAAGHRMPCCAAAPRLCCCPSSMLLPLDCVPKRDCPAHVVVLGETLTCALLHLGCHKAEGFVVLHLGSWPGSVG